MAALRDQRRKAARGAARQRGRGRAARSGRQADRHRRGRGEAVGWGERQGDRRIGAGGGHHLHRHQPGRRQLLTGARDGAARVWSFDRNPEPAVGVTAAADELVELGRAQARRCLTREQREKAFLAPEPPGWCIERAKWPYDTQAWKDWLKYKLQSADPPRPDTPEWQPWLASASAVRGEAK